MSSIDLLDLSLAIVYGIIVGWIWRTRARDRTAALLILAAVVEVVLFGLGDTVRFAILLALSLAVALSVRGIGPSA